MCAEKLRRLITTLGRLLQDLHHADHFVRVVAGIIHKTNTETVRLQFVIAAIL